MTNLWKSRYGDAPASGRCRAAVRGEGRWPSLSQCRRTATVTRDDIGYCHQHDPEVERKRADDRQRQWQEAARAREEAAEFKAATERAMLACKAACQLIADGANDSRRIAREAVALFPSTNSC
ncbi:MAG: hypothetical protein HXX10_07565 [Rhodoplanes sp.]|uniref:hypothetical protein n=1 Tax=Rhodoplanes sp. TaxID=1968906 RepID=UPI00184CFFBE|nr:hypothetical protein [Rhodoplanes sp.]NVO13878.1 hypothetical protein [Rhodoplanes sp.]